MNNIVYELKYVYILLGSSGVYWYNEYYDNKTFAKNYIRQMVTRTDYYDAVTIDYRLIAWGLVV